MTMVSIGSAPTPAQEPDLMIVEPRCKICRSDHRAEIDRMLRRGDSQAAVRQQINARLGDRVFTANNLSVHARKHLYGPDPAEWIRKSARAQRLLGDPAGIPAQTSPEDALRRVLDVGLQLIDAGVTVPEAGDVVRAAKELDRVESEAHRASEAEMLREFNAFMKAVKAVVPQEMWDAVYFEFERLIAQA